MYYHYELLNLTPKWSRIISNGQILMDLIDISLGRFGHIRLELFLLPHLSIEVFRLGRFFFGICSFLGKTNEITQDNGLPIFTHSIGFLVQVEGWNSDTSEVYT